MENVYFIMIQVITQGRGYSVMNTKNDVERFIKDIKESLLESEVGYFFIMDGTEYKDKQLC